MALRFDEIQFSTNGHKKYPTLTAEASAQYLKLSTSHGYINIGSNNASYAHFYTDRPTYYFNAPISVSGNIASYGGTHTASFATYYDSNNTSYYTNPAGTSVMNDI